MKIYELRKADTDVVELGRQEFVSDEILEPSRLFTTLEKAQRAAINDITTILSEDEAYDPELDMPDFKWNTRLREDGITPYWEMECEEFSTEFHVYEHEVEA